MDISLKEINCGVTFVKRLNPGSIYQVKRFRKGGRLTLVTYKSDVAFLWHTVVNSDFKFRL